MSLVHSTPGLREKIGQMFLIGFRGLEISDAEPVARDLAERNLGGVILFDKEMADLHLPTRNIQSPAQVSALVKSIKSFAATPPFIAIDQEGGRVNRLKPEYGFPATLSHEELGALDDPAQTFAHAEAIAKTLKVAGINFNLAPVVDLDANPDNPIIKGKKRSFSADPEIVARHAIEFIKAHQTHGVLSCAKHFPGHGSARGDTHLGLVDVTNFWSDRELLPYRRLIERGICDAVMTAHVFNAKLDAQHPATLSAGVIRGLLRGDLGFAGIVLTDDLEMKAISSHYGLERAIGMAVNAGADVICLGNNMSFDPNIGERAMDLTLKLVGAGEILPERIDESFRRIMEVKQRFQLI
jgi:beta-N-acetylhexosaminidase